MTNVLICGFPVSLANNIIHNGGWGEGGGGLNPQTPPFPPRSATAQQLFSKTSTANSRIESAQITGIVKIKANCPVLPL